MDLVNVFEEAPAYTLALVAFLAVISHLWNAACILDRRRADARNRRATAARLSAGRAFVAAHNAAHSNEPITITGRRVSDAGRSTS